jgi:hypothetical protein
LHGEEVEVPERAEFVRAGRTEIRGVERENDDRFASVIVQRELADVTVVHAGQLETGCVPADVNHT